ncbi:EamA family transporter [Bacillus timonensis]|nr:EamA family transporter [Bacillus timonensis]
MSPIKILLLLMMTMLGALGGFFFKKASSHLRGRFSTFILFLGIGGGFYVIGALLNIYLLKQLPYIIVFPLTSVTYFWSLLLSSFWLHERITRRKVWGILFILMGCLLLTL